MRYFLFILLVTSLAVPFGCQRSYVDSTDPAFPLKQSQISNAKWTNKKVKEQPELNKLKKFSLGSESTER